MNEIDRAVLEMADAITNTVKTIGGILLFIASIPLVFLYLWNRQRVETKLRAAGKWPY